MRASFKWMRDVLSRWMDELELDRRLGLGSCAELFDEPSVARLHTTSAIRYPTFRRRADSTLINYNGQAPAATDHPMLNSIVNDVLVPELQRFLEAIVVPVGKASSVVERLRAQDVIARDRCIRGVPHPSPASPYREQYFQKAKGALLPQSRRLQHRTGRAREQLLRCVRHGAAAQMPLSP